MATDLRDASLIRLFRRVALAANDSRSLSEAAAGTGRSRRRVEPSGDAVRRGSSVASRTEAVAIAVGRGLIALT